MMPSAFPLIPRGSLASVIQALQGQGTADIPAGGYPAPTPAYTDVPASGASQIASMGQTHPAYGVLTDAERKEREKAAKLRQQADQAEARARALKVPQPTQTMGIKDLGPLAALALLAKFAFHASNQDISEGVQGFMGARQHRAQRADAFNQLTYAQQQGAGLSEAERLMREAGYADQEANRQGEDARYNQTRADKLAADATASKDKEYLKNQTEYGDSLDRLKWATPDQIPILLRQINDLGAKLGKPPITDAESAELARSATKREFATRAQKSIPQWVAMLKDQNENVRMEGARLLDQVFMSAPELFGAMGYNPSVIRDQIENVGKIGAKDQSIIDENKSKTHERGYLLEAKLKALEALGGLRTDTAAFIRTKNENYGNYLEAIMGRMDIQNAGVLNSIQDKWDDNKAKAYESKYGRQLDEIKKAREKAQKDIDDADAFNALGDAALVDSKGKQLPPEQIKAMRDASKAAANLAKKRLETLDAQQAAIEKLAPIPSDPIVPPKRSLSGGGSGGGLSRAERNNNPLNIKSSARTNAYPGVTGVESKSAADGGNFLQFDSPESGFAAAKTLIKTSGYAGLNLDAALRRWSNNGYGANVAKSAGLDPSRTVSSLSDSETEKLVQAMASAEGYRGGGGGGGKNKTQKRKAGKGAIPAKEEFTPEQTAVLTRPEGMSPEEAVRRIRADMAMARKNLAKYKGSKVATDAIRAKWAKDHPGIKL